MKYIWIILGLVSVVSCLEKKEPALSAQEIVDRAIAVSGGSLYRTQTISFEFRDNSYVSCTDSGKRVLIRRMISDTAQIEDRRTGEQFERRINGALVNLQDTTKNKLSNAVNSVHYFAYLPYGLNGSAVRKELLGQVAIKDKMYYKIRVTFNEVGGGDDFEDVFVYWFNTSSFRPDYLAYLYHTNGGGIRFRQAINDRQVGGVSFSDYINYRPKDSVAVTALDQLFEEGKLEEISRIALENIVVNPGNCN